MSSRKAAPSGSPALIDIAGAFGALGDPHRLAIIRYLATVGGEAFVGDIERHLVEPIQQPTVSHHLKILHQAGIVEREYRGARVYYRLRAECLNQLIELLGGCAACISE